MPREKRKKAFFDLFGFDKESFFEPKLLSSQRGSGYSMSATYDEKGKPIVKVQTQGAVNVTDLRRDIEKRYPGAKIEGLENQPLIRIVDEEPVSEGKVRKKEEERKEEKEEKKKKKEPLIRVVE